MLHKCKCTYFYLHTHTHTHTHKIAGGNVIVCCTLLIFRGASDSLRELQHDISNEISVMEQNLRTCHSSLLTPDNSDKDVLSVNMARLHIIREVIQKSAEARTFIHTHVHACVQSL